MQVSNAGLRQFRARVQELYRQAVIDDARPTQAQLAQAIGISAKELSLRLSGAPTHRLTQANAQAIVRILAQWQVIRTRAAAVELLNLVDCPLFSEDEWNKPPLAQLTSPTPDAAPAYSIPSAYSLSHAGRDAGLLRERLRDLYRRADPYGTGRPPTQADLAVAIGLERTELNKRLTGSGGKRLSPRDGRAIVRTLAAWGAITTRAEAEELLDLMAIPGFSAAEWTSPPLDALEQVRAARTVNNLPRALTSFIGREHEVATCLRFLAHAPLLTITGVGGIGKTRLSLELAHRSLPDFPDGIYFVQLAQLSDPAMLTSLLGSTLGLSEARSRSDLEIICSHLQNKRVLLLLDNCEHLLAPVAELTTALLTRCPSLVVLATSRERLAIHGEAVFTVLPLTLPAANSSDRATLQASEAVNLFIARAQASQPGFALTEANAEAVAAVCHLLEGIPLAIELAAPLLRTLSAAQIATQLGERFNILDKLPNSSLPHRQQTMYDSIAWSYELLTELERTLFRRLAIFRGGWSLAAAEVVCADGLLPHDEILPTLVRLVDKSLVRAREVDGEMRYQMLETVREYALSQLAGGDAADTVPSASDEAQATHARHLGYFLGLAEEAATHANDASSSQWFTRLEDDLDNIRAALGYATHTADSLLALRLVRALAIFWRVRGLVSESRGWFAAALARRGYERTELRGEVLLSAAHASYSQGDYATSSALAKQALSIARHVRSKLLAANVFNTLGLTAMARSDYPQARVHYSKGLGLWQSLDNKAGLGAALHNLAHIADEQGDYQAAHQLFMRSLSLSEALGHPRMTATTLLGLGDVAMKLGDYLAAEAYLQESLTLARESGDKRNIAGAMAMLGQNAQQMGDYDNARRLLEDSLATMRELGYPMEMTQILTVLARVDYGQGDFSQAAARQRESLQLAAQLGFKQEIAAALEGMAKVASVTARPKRAVTLAAAASTVRQASHTSLVAEGLSEEALADLATTLGADAYASAFARGQTLTLEQAIEYALEDQPVSDDAPIPSRRPSTAIEPLPPVSPIRPAGSH